MISVVIYYVVSVLFFVFIAYRLFFWLHLWQQKEYRFDRVVAYLKETKEGRGIYLGWENIVKSLLLVSYVITIFSDDYFEFFPYIIFLFYSYFFVRLLIVIFQRKAKIPLFTPKISAIVVLVFLLVSGLFVFHPIDIYFWILILDRLVPFFVLLLILFFSIPSDFSKDYTINKSVKKLRTLKHILVIGIAGSYGKGPAKEYLYTILSYKYNVVKSYKRQNTPIGIARVILSELNEKKEIFIVEMGAYKKGEIGEIAKMVNPRIALVTGIGDQHLSLFGGIEKTMRGMYELVDSIPRNGFSLFNGNSELVTKLYNKTHKHKVFYEVLQKKAPVQKNGIFAKDVKVHKFYTEFTSVMNGKNLGRFKVHILGSHQIQYILPAMYIAKTLKMKNSEIRRAIEMILPINGFMEPFVNVKGAVLIDDSQNTNFSSSGEILQYMKQYRQKKIIVLQPFTELGREGKNRHYEIGHEIGNVCDYLIVTNNNFNKELKKGIQESRKVCQFKRMNPSEAAQFIGSFTEKNDIVVFEGREAGDVLSLISHEPIR